MARKSKELKTRWFLKQVKEDGTEEYILIKNIDENLDFKEYREIRQKARQIFMEKLSAIYELKE